MKPRHFALTALALCAFGVQAAPKQAPAKPAQPITAQQACKDPHIQCLDQPITITLRTPDGGTFTQTLPAPNPLLQYDHVYLFPGQTLYIEADVQDDKLVNLHMVPANVHPEKTLVFKFEQPETKGQYGMMLTVHNPFSGWLKYHALSVDADTAPGTFKTNTTCPVIPGSNASENWPVPLIQLVLGDFHFLAPDDPKAKRRCIY